MTSASENKVGLPAGSVVDGRYRVVRVLDLGGTGVVHQVEHVGTGRKLALKTLIDPSNEGRLEQEARAASHLRNSHAVKIVDMGRSPEVGAYIVMELLEGTSLRALIDEVGQLPLDLVANVALQVCECLDEAHASGIVHRDLKPGNVHLAPTFGTHHHVTVLDFGAVKLQGPEIRSQISPQEDLTRVGSTVGTPFYMSLEQLRGNASVDAVSDVYSLCVVLYEMLTGTRPFQADSLGDLVYALVQTKPPRIASIRPDVPPDFADLIERGLSSVRETRPRSAREVAQVLATIGDPAYALWLRVPAARGAAPAAPAVNAPAVKTPAVNAPSGKAPSPPVPPPAPSAPRLAPPPPPSPAVGAPPAPPAPPPRPGLRPASVGTSVLAPAAPRPRPPDPRREPEETSALTAMPSAAMARVTMGEQPTAALPSVADALPDLLQDPTTSSEPTGRREEPAPARTRQDTPTEMFVQEVHGAGPAPTRPPSAVATDDDDDDDGGRTRVAQDVAAAASAAPAKGGAMHRVSRPDLGPRPASDDDNPTSVLDLDALNEAARRKAAAAPATTPPPAPGAPALGLPDLAAPGRGSHHAIGGSGALGSPTMGSPTMGSPTMGAGLAGLPVGASDTMRLDVESLSGPLSHARLAADAEKAGETFDPSRMSLHDAPRSVPGAALQPPPIDAVDTAVHARSQIAPASFPSTGGAPTSGPTKPAWQAQVDQGIAAITASGREATTRFLAWYRILRPNEQMAFVAGAVLGFAIVVMLFILWLR